MKLRAGLSLLLALPLLCGPLPVAAQDFEREKRWADEVVPGLVVGDAVWVDGPGGRKFLGILSEARNAPAVVLLVHGVGVHPDHGVIGALRTSLVDAGYTTLSIQMPVQKADAALADYHPTVFPNAVERIRSAGRWLGGKGYKRIVLLSHSMGSWMSNVYYEETPDPPFAAWVCMGLTGGYGGMRNVKVPVLDVYGEKDLPQVLRADWRRQMTLGSIAGSRQVKIAGADHFYAGKEKELTAAIVAFMRERVSERSPK
jgi:pimeloyl-ACP methyl ester carboxylesterase